MSEQQNENQAERNYKAEFEALEGKLKETNKALLERDITILEMRGLIAQQNVALGNMQLELYGPQHQHAVAMYKQTYPEAAKG